MTSGLDAKLIQVSEPAENCVMLGGRAFSLETMVGVRALGPRTVEVAECVQHDGLCCSAQRGRKLERTVVAVDGSAEAVARQAREALRAAGPEAPARLLVVVNPVSGTGSAKRAWEEYARPVFEAAEIEIDVLVTSRKGEAMDRVAAMVRDAASNNDGFEESALPDGVAIVGGDGTVNEVVRGLFAAGNAKVQGLALAQVPAGSGNGLANTIAAAAGEVASPVDAAFYVVKGYTRPLDVARFDLADGSVLPSFLSFEWAMLADIDLGSEPLRCLGSARFHFAAVHRICCLRKYRGRIAYLPAEAPGLPPASFFDSPPLQLHGPLDDRWLEIDQENFHLAALVNLSHLDASTPLVPTATPDDGALHLIWTAGDTSCATRLDLARGFLEVEGGSHVHKDSVHIAKCRA